MGDRFYTNAKHAALRERLKDISVNELVVMPIPNDVSPKVFQRTAGKGAKVLNIIVKTFIWKDFLYIVRVRKDGEKTVSMAVATRVQALQ